MIRFVGTDKQIENYFQNIKLELQLSRSIQLWEIAGDLCVTAKICKML